MVEDGVEGSVDGFVDQLVVDRLIVAVVGPEARDQAALVEIGAVVEGEVGAQGRQEGVVGG